MGIVNYFEVLGAPTSSDDRLIAQYAAAASHLDVNQRSNYRRELINPINRLYSELTTVRIEKCYTCDSEQYKKIQTEKDRIEYLEYFKKLTRSQAEPIEHAYAGAWFKKLMTVISDSNTSNIEVFASRLSRTDPWLLQGLAACVLRVAINSEKTESEIAAPYVWDLALSLYRSFFSADHFANSFTYKKIENNSKVLNECRGHWNCFFISLIKEMGNRIDGYFIDKDYYALNSCVNVLNNNYFKEDEKRVVKEKYNDLGSKFSQNIQNCPRIADAADLYYKCPEIIRTNDADNRLSCALVESMTKESKCISTGCADIENLEKWSFNLNIKNVYQEQSRNVHQITLVFKTKSFFDEVAKQIRNKLNTEDKSHPLDFYELVRLIDLLPDDYSIGKQPDGSYCTAAQIKTNRITGILNDLQEADVESASTIDDVKKFGCYHKKNERFFTTNNVGGSMTLKGASDIVYTNIFVSCINKYEGDLSNIDKSNLDAMLMRLLQSGKDISNTTANELAALAARMQPAVNNKTSGQKNARTIALTVAGFFTAGKKIQEYPIADLFARLNAVYPRDIIPVVVTIQDEFETTQKVEKKPKPVKQEEKQPAKTPQPVRQEVKKPAHTPQPVKQPVKPAARKATAPPPAKPPATTPAKTPATTNVSGRIVPINQSKQIMKLLNQRTVIDYLFIGTVAFILPLSLVLYFIIGEFSLYLLFLMVLITMCKFFFVMAVYFRHKTVMKKGKHWECCSVRTCKQEGKHNRKTPEQKSIVLCKDHLKQYETIMKK